MNELAGTTPPLASDDRRIAFYWNGEPVYRARQNGVAMPKQLYAPDPEYSEAARRLQVGGRVYLGAILGPDGNVRKVWIRRPLGFGLDEAAVRSVERWRFEPGTLAGRPVNILLSVDVSFCLY